jgi:hypothetical protein
MPNIYKKEIVKDRILGLKQNLREITVSIAREDKKTISMKELKDLYDDVYNKSKKEYPECKMLVRALNPIQWFTLKNYSDDTIQSENIDDYLQNNLHDTKKFDQFFQIQFMMIRNK